MSKPYKPDGYSTVSPYLIVDGAEGTIAFLQAVFGAEELRRFEDDSGQLNHAEVRLYDTVLMIADRKEGWPSNPAHIHIYVPDVDTSYQTALDYGATSIQAPEKKQDPDRRSGVQDAGGTTWWIATNVE